MFMLDTNILIALQNTNLKVARKVAELDDEQVAISSIVEMEFRSGLEGLEGDSIEYQLGISILDTLRVYPFDSAAAQRAAHLKGTLSLANC